MEKLNSVEDLRKNIGLKLEKAKQNAIPKEEAIDIIKKIEILRFDKSISDASEQIQNLENKLDNSTVTVHTLVEFRILVEKTTDDKDQITHLLSHENAHANMAEVVGATHEGYSILVCKDGDGYFFIPSSKSYLPEGGDSRKNIESAIRISAAPEEYGDRLSSSDKRKINELRKGLI